ncbi:MAG: hypothetical protein CMF69_12815 [Magnetovibrio sp.]|nr:hypothetical protein [Magnetovibrio sp.]|tara:strand:- start:1340 stop:1954 length:615 start_codon:yes stop_codon:yes gene_type:complete
MSYSHLFRIILVGDPNVGKTTLLATLNNKYIPQIYEPTIGVEFASTTTTVHDNNIVKSHIWDTAGQEYFNAITKYYFRNIAGAIFVFDLSRPNTFKRIKYWLNELKNVNKLPFKMMLIGNKNDLERKISYSIANAFANKYNMLYYECCAHKDKFFYYNHFINSIYSSLPEKITSGMGVKILPQQQPPYIHIQPKTKSNICCQII